MSAPDKGGRAGDTYVCRTAKDPLMAEAVLSLEAVEVVAPSGEVLDVVPGWAVARRVMEAHVLSAAVTDLRGRLAAVEAELRALRAAS